MYYTPWFKVFNGVLKTGLDQPVRPIEPRTRDQFDLGKMPKTGSKPVKTWKNWELEANPVLPQSSF